MFISPPPPHSRNSTLILWKAPLRSIGSSILFALLILFLPLSTIHAQCPDYDFEMRGYIPHDDCCQTIAFGIDSDDFNPNMETDYFFFSFGLNDLSSCNPLITNATLHPSLSDENVDLFMNPSGVTLFFDAELGSNDPFPTGVLTDKDAVVIEVCGDRQLGLYELELETVGQSPSLDIFNGATDCSPTSPFTILVEYGYRVQGLVQTANMTCPGGGNNIEGADFSITKLTKTDIVSTDLNGEYVVNRCDDAPYEICALTTCEEPCDLTAQDVLFGRQYLLGAPSGFGYLIDYIGDVNESGHFSTHDLAIMEAWVNGVNLNSYPDSWCKFYPVAEVTAGNIGTLLDQCVSSDNYSVGDNDFMRIELGDIDGSCNDCVHGDGSGDFPIIVVEDDDGVSLYTSSIDEKIIGLALDVEAPVTKIENVCTSPFEGSWVNKTENGVRLFWVDLKEEDPGLLLSGENEILRLKGVRAEDLKLNYSSGHTVMGTYRNIYMPQLVHRDVVKTARHSIVIMGSTVARVDIGCSSPISYNVYSSSGFLMDSNPIVSNRIELTESSWTSGIYFVEILFQDGTRQIKKVLL